MTILGLDWGGRRVGIARAHAKARLAEPLVTLPNNEGLTHEIERLVDSEEAETLVVGLPRNLDGEETAQSQQIRQFVRDLKGALQCEIIMQDETLSSAAASEMYQRYPEAGLDSCAAAVILQDYLNSSLA